MSQFALLKSRNFLPLFVTQAIGAFNDNGLRNGIAILITFDLAVKQGWDATLFVQAGLALFMLPYFLFSGLAGQLADIHDKAMLARAIKAFELGVMVFGAFALWLTNPFFHLTVLFLAGTTAAFFGPIKYGVLPQYLKREDLVGGNALIELGTFVTILLGTLFGGLLVLTASGKAVLAATIIALSVLALAAAFMMPKAPGQAHMKFDWNAPRQTLKLLGYARERKDVFWSVIGASWFWFMGAAILAQFPVFTKDVLLADDTVANIFIGTFTIGIGAGSILAARLLKGEVSARFAPFAAIMMTVFLLDLYFAAGSVQAVFAGTALNAPGVFFGHWSGWRVGFDLFFTAFFGGIYAVPLNAIMQHRSHPAKRSRVIAANNVMNAIFMIGSTLLAATLLQVMTAQGFFLVLAIANGVAAICVIWLLPQETFASFARILFRLFYRVEVRGLEHFHAAGRKAVVVANHTSLLDGPLLQAFMPGRASFAINSHIAKHWWTKPTHMLFNMISIDPTNPLALRAIVEELKKGRRVVIFPEGRLTVTGTLMKIYEGPGAIAHMANAKVLPVRIDGAQFTGFSKMRGKLRLRWFPRITLTFLPPVKFDAPEGLRGSALREYQADRLNDVMTGMVFKTSNIDQTLFEALLDARATHGGKHKILEDIQRAPLTYDRLVAGSFVLGRKIAAATPGEKHVAMLLPNSAATIVTMFGLQIFGRIPAMLNFSTGPINMSAACVAAEVSTIVTSRRFIEAGEMEEDLKVLAENRKVIYLEGIRAEVGLADKLYGLFAKTFPRVALRHGGGNADPNGPACVLFTSGSEGVPKGVVLSHRNLHANRHQAAARIDFTAQDIVFNALPMFHAFGLLAGVVLPLMAGLRSFQYPSPLHYKIVPELAYDTNATVLFGTDTFLQGYARSAHPYDFYNVRLVVAGAERVKPETRQMWMEKFGLRILEGYGATECSPAVAFNTPMYNRSGTVGRLFNGIETRLEKIDGIEEGGRLHVKGPNVMLGYLRADNPGVIEAPPGGWYDTGDIAKFDDKGFLVILGRAKRFAKVAGEMVSLTAVESQMQSVSPGHAHAVVAVPDAKKGEQIVAFTTDSALERKALAGGMKKQGATELMIPKTIVALAEIPLLGTGKTDYVSLNRLAREKVTS